MIWAIDDQRNFPDAQIIIRNGESAMDILEKLCYENVLSLDKLYLDHDLGGKITGYDIACRIEELSSDFDIKQIIIVSDNSVGIKNIQAALQKQYDIGPDGRTLTKKE
jgi:hypothetical protein